MAKQIIVTEEGLKKLESELDHLKNVKRKEVVEAIGVAKSFGDLSENSEYDEAMNEQAKIEAKIRELEEQLKVIKVVSSSDINTDSVNVGISVKVYDEDFDEEVVYTIVGSTEADPMSNKISDQSPVGNALIGRKVGEVVTAETPGGEVKLKILEIFKQD